MPTSCHILYIKLPEHSGRKLYYNRVRAAGTPVYFTVGIKSISRVLSNINIVVRRLDSNESVCVENEKKKMSKVMVFYVFYFFFIVEPCKINNNNPFIRAIPMVLLCKISVALNALTS